MYESGICLAVLFALYWLVLRKETYFQFNRLYLLGTLLVSCLLPLGHLNLFGPGTSSLSALPQMAKAISIPDLIIAEGSKNGVGTAKNWQIVVMAIYLTGASLLLARTILGIIRVNMLKRRGKMIKRDGYSLVHLSQEIAPFSFFRTIFLNNTGLEDSDEQYILDHELIHMKQHHSYDILFVEILLSIFWFNPFLWFIKRALKSTHEYLADDGVIKEIHTPSNYQSLLLNQITGFMPTVVTNSFNSNIKNRIKMMCRNKSSVLAKFKPLLLLPVLACLILLIACNEQANTPIEIIEPDMTLQKPDFPEGEEVYYVVEEMPKFNGGEPAMEFRKYIAQNLQYPEAAAEDSISGRVIVQFTVNKKGKVVNAVIVRKADPYLDEEALRVTLSSPLWTPGKQAGKEVNVLFTFPINFVIQ